MGQRVGHGSRGQGGSGVSRPEGRGGALVTLHAIMSSAPPLPNGQGWLQCSSTPPTAMPASSIVSRRTASSTDSQLSMNPARQLVAHSAPLGQVAGREQLQCSARACGQSAGGEQRACDRSGADVKTPARSRRGWESRQRCRSAETTSMMQHGSMRGYMRELPSTDRRFAPASMGTVACPDTPQCNALSCQPVAHTAWPTAAASVQASL